MHKRCAAILIELQKEGSIEFWDEFQFAPKQSLTKRLRDILEIEVDEKYYLSHTMTEYLSKKDRAIKPYDGTQNEAPCLQAVYYKTPTDGFYVKEPLNIGKTKTEGRPVDNFIKVIGKLDCKGGDDNVYDAEGISPCLTTMQGGGQEPKILQKSPEWRTDGTLREFTDYAPAIRAEMGDNLPMVKEPIVNRIRKLTPLECWRLQDFPDDAHEKAKYKKEILHFLFVYGKTIKSKKETQCNLLNAKLMDANESQKQSNTETYALCTTKECTRLEQLIKQYQADLIERNQNVSFVIEKLEGQAQKECAISTIRWIDCTETLYTEMISSGSLDIVVTLETQKAKQFIESSWKITLEENLTAEKLFITLIALRVIIELKIFTYVKIKANIEGFIVNLKKSKNNSYKIMLSDLKMENITQRVSDSMLYKQAGNAMTVGVLEMIFRQIEKAKEKDPQSLF